jgi:hypothetical protein
MTNADVTSAVNDIQGRTLTLTYKGGEKRIAVPKSALIVKYFPGSRSDLVRGAEVSATAQQEPDGKLIVTRISVAENGARLPF